MMMLLSSMLLLLLVLQLLLPSVSVNAAIVDGAAVVNTPFLNAALVVAVTLY